MMLRCPTWPALAAALLSASAVGMARAAPPPVPEVSAQGAHVAHGGLQWARCVEGMRWDGRRCLGEPLLLTHAEALARAQSRSQEEGQRWRVPKIQELRHLYGRQGPEAALFPAAPGGWHWSSSANLRQSNINPYAYKNTAPGAGTDVGGNARFVQGWAFNLSTGEGRGDMAKHSRLPVRLVLMGEQGASDGAAAAHPAPQR